MKEKQIYASHRNTLLSLYSSSAFHIFDKNFILIILSFSIYQVLRPAEITILDI